MGHRRSPLPNLLHGFGPSLEEMPYRSSLTTPVVEQRRVLCKRTSTPNSGVCWEYACHTTAIDAFFKYASSLSALRRSSSNRLRIAASPTRLDSAKRLPRLSLFYTSLIPITLTSSLTGVAPTIRAPESASGRLRSGVRRAHASEDMRCAQEQQHRR